MERLIELGQLLDWYGPLLTARQASLVRQYAFEDCSLAEIAEREGITRQGVRDSIARAEAEMLEMERKLRLVERTKRTRAWVDAVAAVSGDPAIRAKLNELTDIWEEDDGV